MLSLGLRVGKIRSRATKSKNFSAANEITGMPDGSRGTSKGLYLGTDSFTYTDVERLTHYLMDRYNLKCSIHKAGGNLRIYILAKSVETVKNLVLPFMHKSMLYKLGV